MSAPTSRPPLTIRPAGPTDVGTVMDFIRGLAEYEHLTHALEADETALAAVLFGRRPYAEVLLAEEGDAPVGFALFFHTLSTFSGKPNLYLEDLFVQPAARGRGYGKALMIHLARLAVERGCGRFEWSVLDWNAPSIDFYRSLGAQPLDDWTVYRVDGDALARLAGRD